MAACPPDDPVAPAAPPPPPIGSSGGDTGGDTGGVMHVITGLGIGGAESMLAALASAEAAAGAPPDVVSLTPGGPMAARLRAAGVTVTDLAMAPGRPDPRGVLRLARLIRRRRPAVVQGWMYHANLAATAALALSGRRRRTMFFWGIRCSDMDLDTHGFGLRLAVRAGALLSRRPNAILCNSEAGIAVHRALGYRPRHFVLVDNGIDTARFRPDPDARAALRAALGIAPQAPVVVGAARVDPMKDNPTLLAALDLLRAQRPGIVVLVMGTGVETALPDRPDLIRLGRRDDPARVFSAGDLVVSSSAYGEGFSNVLAEGMACGLSAAATDVGDARRIVGDTGAIVAPRDLAALAAAIARLIDDPGRVVRGCAARRRIVENFSLTRAVTKFRTLYADARAAQQNR